MKNFWGKALCFLASTFVFARAADGYEITPVTDFIADNKKAEEKSGENDSDNAGGFTFGSYGRVQAATDARGGEGKGFNIVSHPPRLHEKSYLELEFRYDWAAKESPDFTMVSTLAFGEELFHYSRDFELIAAVRNLYLSADNLFIRDLRFWAGSRMYRGDDIYLFDFWLLDNLNTYGGGVGYTVFATEADWHIGFSRSDNPYQTQYFTFASEGLSTADVLVMERQRLVTSLKLTHFLFRGGGDSLGLKLKLYGELHSIPASDYLVDFVENEWRHYPKDGGLLVGGQIGVWNFGYNSFANIFARYAKGLAAYGEIKSPYDLNNDKTTEGAREFQAGVSANYQILFVGLVLGGYARYFEDADIEEIDLDDKWEFAFAFRPHFFLHKNFYLGFEVSYQYLAPNGLARDFIAEDEKRNAMEKAGESVLVAPIYRGVRPSVLTASIIPTLTLGGGTYGRPALRIVASITSANDDAKLLLNENDPRLNYDSEYFIGVAAEWWFNSTSYR